MGGISLEDGFKSWQGLAFCQGGGIKGDKMAAQRFHEEALWEAGSKPVSLWDHAINKHG